MVLSAYLSTNYIRNPSNRLIFKLENRPGLYTAQNPGLMGLIFCVNINATILNHEVVEKNDCI